MKIVTRTAVIEDSDAITRLSEQLGYTTTNDKMVKRLSAIVGSEQHCVFVACNKDGVVGWIHGVYSQRVESDPFVEIGGLVVDSNYRNKGIGKMLIRAVIDWTHRNGIVKLRVRSNITRRETHEFYKKYGFKEVKEQKVFDLDF